MMLRLAILALFAVFASAIPAHAWLFRTVGGGPVVGSQTIASVGPSTGSFTGGASSGTVVATMATVMSPASPAFSGTYTLSTTLGACNGTNGAQNADFQISGSSLELNGTQASGTYLVCVAAQQGGISNSPQSVAMTITGTSAPADTQTVADDSGSGATNYPLQEGHPFIEGEISSAACVQATYAGSQIETQTDIINVWPDGSIKMAVLSMVLPSIVAGTPGTLQTLAFAPTTSGSRSTNHCFATGSVAADSTPIFTSASGVNSAYNFDSVMAFTPTGGSVVNVSALAMLTAAGTCSTTDPWSSHSVCKTFYYGPVMQEIGLWDGNETTTCPGGSNAASTYDIPSGYGDNICPVRPMFYATFWAATHQVQMRAVAMSGLFNAYEDARYVISITAGNTSPVTVLAPTDYTGLGNATGEGNAGVVANQTVSSSYTGTLAITGTPASPITLGTLAYWVDQNTGEDFQATYTSTTQLTIPTSGCNQPTEQSGCRALAGQGPAQAITSGDPLVNAFIPKQHWAATVWSQRYWIGSTPDQEVNINHNLAYTAWTHYIPNYDQTATLSDSTIQGLGCGSGGPGYDYAHGYVGWWTGCPHQPYDGWWDGGIVANGSEAVGGRPEIGINPSWDAWWLSSGDWRMQTTSEGVADLASAFAFHMINTNTTDVIQRYDSPGTGLGLPVTLQGHGGIFAASGYWPSLTQANYPADAPAAMSHLNTNGIWTYQIELTHAADEFYVPYIMTGDPWYLEEMWQWTTFSASSASYPPKISNGPSENSGPLDTNNNPTYRASTFVSRESRGMAWDFRNRAHAALAAPDGDPQGTYYLALLNDSLASMAGSQQIGASSPYYNTTMYNFVVTNGSFGNCSAAGFTVPTDPSLGIVGCDNVEISVGVCWAQSGGYAQEGFFQWYAADAAGTAAEAGFPNELLLRYTNFESGLINTAYPLLYLPDQQFPITDNSGAFFANTAAYLNNVTTAPQGISWLTNSPPFPGSDNCAGGAGGLPQDFADQLGPSGYAVYGQASLAEAIDAGNSGATMAWNNWYYTNVYQALVGAGTGGESWNQDNSWDIVPRPAGNTAPIPPPVGWSPTIQ